MHATSSRRVYGVLGAGCSRSTRMPGYGVGLGLGLGLGLALGLGLGTGEGGLGEQLLAERVDTVLLDDPHQARLG